MANLAVNGGTPLYQRGEYQHMLWPPVNEETADRMRELYLSRAWSFNSKCEQDFENEFAKIHDAEYGIFMVNGTVTLEAALAALAIGPGDEVIIPALTWVATAMAAKYVGAKIVMADIDPETLTLDPAAFEAAITPRTKAVIPVHLYGSMADLEKICAIADRHHIAVVEDCAHMQGGKWAGRGVGSWGSIGSFSFQQSKMLSGGEGGICITNDPQLAERLYRFKHIGYSRYDRQGSAATPPPPGLVCHNYRGQAFSALALSGQLPGLPDVLNRCEAYYNRFCAGIADIPGIRVQKHGRLATRQGYYGFGIMFEGEPWLQAEPARIWAAIEAEGVPFEFNYGPVYRHRLFNLGTEDYRLPEGGCPITETLYQRLMGIKHYNMYYPEEADKYVAVIRKLAANIKELC
ncbi:MAG: DegT/DnrJ/EryC1/StrS family aminotransferase [Lentisphaeria bacterium]|nr:DegT/DnrJ/EryC1/StrS family aminotransferase [Lentisphaeria bacterium]